MKLRYSIAPLALMAMTLSGCESWDGWFRGSDASSSRTVKVAPTVATYNETQRLAQLEKQNAELRSANAQLMSDIETAKSSNVSMTRMSGDADLPPAKPGECYARILIPASYKTATERVIDTEGSERVEVIPAKYETVQERILVQEASERLEVIPATYKTVTETVVVAPAREELRTVPAKYRTVTERVLVREGYTTWKKGEGPIGGSYDGGTITSTRETPTGEIMCLVEVPAEYRTVTKQVLVEPAKTTSMTIPAQTQTVQKRVIDRAASTRPTVIPAQYKTVSVRRMVEPAKTRTIPIPATYKTITRQEKVTDERLVWREVLCETNTTPDLIRRVQTALNKNGFSIAQDGVLGPSTMRAIDAYQRRNGLGTGGLTVATAKKLGVM